MKTINDIKKRLTYYKENPEKWRFFYNEHLLKYTAVYNEWFAEEICSSNEIIDALTTIPQSQRCEQKKKYQMGHNGYSDIKKRIDPERSKNGLLDYNEKNLAVAIYNNQNDITQTNAIGSVIDYEVPMKADNETYDGKIDIIAKKGKVLNLIELKCDTKESILRAFLEACTYYQRLDRDKLLDEWNLKDGKIEITLLLEKSGYAGRQACELDKYKNVSKLLQIFSEKLKININIVVFTYNPDNKSDDAFLLSGENEGKYKILLKAPIIYEIKK